MFPNSYRAAGDAIACLFTSHSPSGIECAENLSVPRATAPRFPAPPTVRVGSRNTFEQRQ
jgi:hypothetical protein